MKTLSILILLLLAAFCAMCTSEIVVGLFGWNPHHFNEISVEKKVITTIYKDFSWYFVFFLTFSFFLDKFVSELNTKKFIALLAMPFFFVLLINSLVLFEKMSLLSLLCYSAGFLSGYIPQFVFDQKAIATKSVNLRSKNPG